MQVAGGGGWLVLLTLVPLVAAANSCCQCYKHSSAAANVTSTHLLLHLFAAPLSLNSLHLLLPLSKPAVTSLNSSLSKLPTAAVSTCDDRWQGRRAMRWHKQAKGEQCGGTSRQRAEAEAQSLLSTQVPDVPDKCGKGERHKGLKGRGID